MLCGTPKTEKRGILQALATDAQAYRRNAEEIEGKVGKSLLLDNPEHMRLKSKRQKSHKVASNVFKSAQRRTMDGALVQALSLDQLQPLHQLWQRYMKDLFSATQYRPPPASFLILSKEGGILRMLSCALITTAPIWPSYNRNAPPLLANAASSFRRQ